MMFPMTVPLFILQAAVAEPRHRPAMLTPSGGLMIWTLLIFLALLLILTRFAFRPITAAVERREQALEAALVQATQDRDAAAALVAQQRVLAEQAHVDATRVVAEARAAAERVRQGLLEHAHAEQQEILRRARGEIDRERQRAIAELRREAVDLAILGAGKVIEKNLDDATNRALVEQFLATIRPAPTGPAARG
jgi:F-type H+-transporting ATPase subunit b